MIILPRQARDRHSENSKMEMGFFRRAFRREISQPGADPAALAHAGRFAPVQRGPLGGGEPGEGQVAEHCKKTRLLRCIDLTLKNDRFTKTGSGQT